MTRKQYSEEVKAAALAALLAGQAVGEIAKTYDIPASTLRSWKSKQLAGEHVITQKKERIGDLLVDYLETNLKALKAQAEFVSDPAWLREQSAADLAVLHGVMTDKAVRLLEAFSKKDGSQS